MLWPPLDSGSHSSSFKYLDNLNGEPGSLIFVAGRSLLKGLWDLKEKTPYWCSFPHSIALRRKAGGGCWIADTIGNSGFRQKKTAVFPGCLRFSLFQSDSPIPWMWGNRNKALPAGWLPNAGWQPTPLNAPHPCRVIVGMTGILGPPQDSYPDFRPPQMAETSASFISGTDFDQSGGSSATHLRGIGCVRISWRLTVLFQ